MVPLIDTDFRATNVVVDLKTNKPVLKSGVRKAEVVELRKLLAHWNIHTHTDSNIFDVQLENEVRRFQRRVFLKEDGVVGPLTWHALYTGCPINMPVLSMGSSGAEVVQLQRSLKVAGIYLGLLDGMFGSQTDQAVRAFQRRKGLVVDGVVGTSTWRALSR